MLVVLVILNIPCILCLFNISFLSKNDQYTFVKLRNKRALIYPQGDNYLQVISGIGIPVPNNRQSATLGLTIKGIYRLPHNSSYFSNPHIPDVSSRKKRYQLMSRTNIYEALAKAAERFGLDGKACILKIICQVAETPFDQMGDIFDELLFVLFTPSATSDHKIFLGENREYLAAEKLGRNKENCDSSFPKCKFNILKRFTKII